MAVLLLLLAACDDPSLMGSLKQFYAPKKIILMPEIEGIWGAMPNPLQKGAKTNDRTVGLDKLDTTAVWTIRRQLEGTSVLKNRLGNDSVVYRMRDNYVVTMVNRDSSLSQYSFEVTFFQINKTVYADFYPSGNNTIQNSKLASDGHLKLHTLARVTRTSDGIALTWLSSKTVREMLEQKRVRLNYEWIPSIDRMVLTGSSAQLTDMLETYGDQQRFIDWENQSAKLHLTQL